MKLPIFLAFVASTSLLAQVEPLLMSQEPQIVGMSNSFPDAPETIIWGEDFSSGIPTGWSNIGYKNFNVTTTISNNNGGSVPAQSALVTPWEYRGPNSTPSANIGSRGGYAGVGQPIQSPTRSNGFVIFDSDFIINSGTYAGSNNHGIHQAQLITSSINLSGYQNVDLNFYQYYRRFAGPTFDPNNPLGVYVDLPATYIDFSLNNGPWIGNLKINDNFGFNLQSFSNSKITLPIGAFVGNSSNVRIRFRFEGQYYFWMIDDITITDSPTKRIDFYGENGGHIPELYVSDFSHSNHALPGEIKGVEGHSLKFTAKLYNSGTSSLNSPKLIVHRLDSNLNLLDSVSGVANQSLVSVNDSFEIQTNDPLDFPSIGKYYLAILVRSAPGYKVSYGDTLVYRSNREITKMYYETKGYSRVKSGGGNALSSSYMGSGQGYARFVIEFPVTVPDTLDAIDLFLQNSYVGSGFWARLYDSLSYANSGNWLNQTAGNVQVADSINNKIKGYFCQPIYLTRGNYYCEIWMFNAPGYSNPSNNSDIQNHPFRLVNDVTVVHGSANRTKFDQNGFMYPSYSRTAQFNSPKIEFRFKRDLTYNRPTRPSLILLGDSVYCSTPPKLIIPQGYSSVNWFVLSSPNSPFQFGGDTLSTQFLSESYFAITVVNGCEYISDTIHVRQAPYSYVAISNSGANVICQGQQVTLTAMGSPALSYSWNTGATTQSITVSSAGTYSVTISDQYGCSRSAYKTIQVLPVPQVQISYFGSLDVCGGSVTLFAPAGGTSYLWSNGATSSSIVVSNPGSYSVSVGLLNGCTAQAPAVQVTNSLIPPTVTASGALTFCDGGSVTLSAPSGGSYSWSNGATTQSITVTQSGSYTVTVTSSSGCSATSTATQVTVLPMPTATVTASGALTFCDGGSVTLSAPSGGSYAWSNGATTQSITVTQSGSYTVTVTSSSGCSATSTATQVTVLPMPTASVTASGALTFCDGGSVTLSAPSGGSYAWSNGATTQSITVTQSGSYSVTVTSSSGCSATSTATQVTVLPMPTASVTASGALTFCDGGSVTLSAPSGGSYAWSNGATTQSITVTQSGSYSVTVTSSSGCSATSTATQVTVLPMPTASVTASGALTFCDGGSVTLSAPSGGSYAWSNGATTQSITVTQSGSYTVTVTSSSGCSATSTATQVTVLPMPTASVTASGALTFCDGGSVTLSAPSGGSYAWSNGATTQSITVTQSGSYSVTVTSSSGCSATSTATQVTVLPMPTASVTASGALTFCDGGSVTLSAPSGGSYAWSNGATTQSITVTQSGSYSVTVTSSSGCSATSTATQVTVLPMPTASVTASGALTFCDGGSVTLSAPSGGSYAWSNGATTQSITVTQSGSYTVTVTSSSGCSATSTATQVTVLPMPTASVTASGALTFCDGGSVTLSAPSGGSYAWSNGATTQSITVTQSGSYTVTVTSSSGCSSTSTATQVTVIANSVIPIIYGNLIVAQGSQQTYYTSQNTGNTYNWQVIGGSVISGQGTNVCNIFMGTSGTIKIIVIESDSYCSSSDTLVVYSSGIGMIDQNRNDMVITPNPSSGKFWIRQLSTPLEPWMSISIFDYLGKAIISDERPMENPEYEISVPGIYIIRAVTANNIFESKIVITN